MDYRVISIGTLSRHPFWNENEPVRTPHATTTLIRTGDRVIVVDPGLPAPALAARLYERTGLRPGQVTDVFLTHFRPAHRGGLDAFENAKWWISEQERENIGVRLVGQFDQETDEQRRDTLKQEIALLKRFNAAPDKLAEGVDLFPMPGFSPGTCGLLLPLPRITLLIASDAVPTAEHLDHGQVLDGCYDSTQARESMREAIEIADWLIPGHDNLVPNPAKGMF